MAKALYSKNLVENYTKSKDWRTKENSNSPKSFGGLVKYISGEVSKNYYLNHVYGEKIRKAYLNGDIHIHDIRDLTVYCCGYSLETILMKGVCGVSNIPVSSPAKHFSSVLAQVINLTTIFQNEQAGAVAFNSVDTLLAPFIAEDGLTYKEVRQTMQNFIYAMNSNSRCGCVPSTTELLTPSGFKKYSELSVGDLVYTWDDGKLNVQPINKMNVFDVNEELYSFKGRDYSQTVTSGHRVLRKKFNVNKYEVKYADELSCINTEMSFPVAMLSNDLGGIDMSDEMIELLAFIITDGGFDKNRIRIYKSQNRWGNERLVEILEKLNIGYYLSEYTSSVSCDEQHREYAMNKYGLKTEDTEQIRDLLNYKKEIPEILLGMNKHQAELFINTWVRLDGTVSTNTLQCDDDKTADMIQHIAFLAGYGSRKYIREKSETNKTLYVQLYLNKNKGNNRVEKIPYQGIVWCPTTKDGIVVFREDGRIFVSGNSEPAFSNISLDVTIPPDMMEKHTIIGGKITEHTYSEYQREMNMFNRAFCELMIQGDSNGKPFAYPLPNYNIGKRFDWDNPHTDAIFEMAGKYGYPYFSNYLNSEMEEGDLRSMALMGTQYVIFKDSNGRVTTDQIRHLVTRWIKLGSSLNYKMLMNGEFVDIIDMFKVPYSNYSSYVNIQLENGYSQSFSMNHKCQVYSNGKFEIKESDVINSNDSFVLSSLPWGIKNSIGTYTSGKILGYFIAEGWVESKSTSQITFAINIMRTDIVEEISKFFKAIGCDVKATENIETNIFRVEVYGKQAVGFANQYVSGTTAKTKRLGSKIWNTCDDFRLGIYDGYLDTDGCESANIFAHTTNEPLCKDFIVLASSIGKILKYQVNKNNTRYFKADKSDLEKFTSYKLIIPKYNKVDGYYIVPVSSVTFKSCNTEYVYNFTVNTEDHLFELPNGIITHQCCRLRLDLEELRRRNGGLFGSGDSTGSIGVCTINLPRIAYRSKHRNFFQKLIDKRTDEEYFYDELDRLLILSKDSLEIKRKFLQEKVLDGGLIPAFSEYVGTLSNHFSTIGDIGKNEMCMNFLGEDILSVNGHDFAFKVGEHIRLKLQEFQKETGVLYNYEQSPAESTCYRLAKKDREKYPEIYTQGSKEVPYYTNSCHIPVRLIDSIAQICESQNDLQPQYTGGNVTHFYLNGAITGKQAKHIIKTVFTNYKLPYVTLSPIIRTCKSHGYVAEEVDYCPKCGEKLDKQQRITGYIRPVENFNAGKAQEFEERSQLETKTKRSKLC